MQENWCKIIENNGKQFVVRKYYDPYDELEQIIIYYVEDELNAWAELKYSYADEESRDKQFDKINNYDDIKQAIPC